MGHPSVQARLTGSECAATADSGVTTGAHIGNSDSSLWSRRASRQQHCYDDSP